MSFERFGTVSTTSPGACQARFRALRTSAAECKKGPAWGPFRSVCFPCRTGRPVDCAGSYLIRRDPSIGHLERGDGSSLCPDIIMKLRLAALIKKGRARGAASRSETVPTNRRVRQNNPVIPPSRLRSCYRIACRLSLVGPWQVRRASGAHSVGRRRVIPTAAARASSGSSVIGMYSPRRQRSPRSS